MSQVCAILGCTRPIRAVYTGGEGLCLAHAHARGSQGRIHPATLPPLPEPTPEIPPCDSPTCLVSGCSAPHEARGCCEIHGIILRNAPSLASAGVLEDPATCRRLRPFWPLLFGRQGRPLAAPPNPERMGRRASSPAAAPPAARRHAAAARRPAAAARRASAPSRGEAAVAVVAPPTPIAAEAAPESVVPVQKCPLHPKKPQLRYGLCRSCVAQARTASQLYARRPVLPGPDTLRRKAVLLLDQEAATAARWTCLEAFTALRSALLANQEAANRAPAAPAPAACSARVRPPAPSKTLSSGEGVLSPGPQVPTSLPPIASAPRPPRPPLPGMLMEAQQAEEPPGEALEPSEEGSEEEPVDLLSAEEAAELMLPEGLEEVLGIRPTPEDLEAWGPEDRAEAAAWLVAASMNDKNSAPTMPGWLWEWFVTRTPTSTPKAQEAQQAQATAARPLEAAEAAAEAAEARAEAAWKSEGSGAEAAEAAEAAVEAEAEASGSVQKSVEVDAEALAALMVWVGGLQRLLEGILQARQTANMLFNEIASLERIVGQLGSELYLNLRLGEGCIEASRVSSIYSAAVPIDEDAMREAIAAELGRQLEDRRQQLQAARAEVSRRALCLAAIRDRAEGSCTDTNTDTNHDAAAAAK